jgi:Ca2+-binding EF-hand superfamily protein
VTVATLGMALRSFGVDLSEGQLQAFVGAIDDDFNGSISIGEFKAAVALRKPRKESGGNLSSLDVAWRAVLRAVDANPRSWERQLVRLFHTFDKDASGEIDISELEAGLVAMQVHLSVDAMMALRDDLDTNRDGHISLHEFETAVHRHKKLKMKALHRPDDRATLDEAWEVLLGAAKADGDWPTTLQHLFRKLDTDGSVRPVGSQAAVLDLE